MSFSLLTRLTYFGRASYEQNPKSAQSGAPTVFEAPILDPDFQATSVTTQLSKASLGHYSVWRLDSLILELGNTSEPKMSDSWHPGAYDMPRAPRRPVIFIPQVYRHLLAISVLTSAFVSRLTAVSIPFLMLWECIPSLGNGRLINESQ